MSFLIADRVRETTTTTGTGSITLAGAVSGYDSFGAGIGNGNTTYYCIASGSEWEVGIGTYASSGSTLSRNTVLSSSNADALVNFSSGTKDVFTTSPASKLFTEGTVHAATPKAMLADADEIGVLDSAASYVLKLLTFANLKASLAGIFASLSGATFSGLVNLDDGADIASASTVDLTAATGNTVRITGTTAITAFTMNAGQQMELVAVGALPLTYNATTMNINGGVPYTCAAGDRLKVFKDSAGVVRVNVTKQDGSAVTQSSSASSFKNKIIGGDFTINPWQRGSNFAAIADAAYSADRWQFRNTSAGVVSVLKTADSPTAAQSGTYSTHCLHVDVTTADSSIAAGDLMAVRQKIEGLNSASLGVGQAGVRYVTLSFWHKHTKTGTHCVAFRNSAANRSYVAEYTQSVTDAWELATVTIAVDTSGTWLYDTGVGLDVVFTMAAGSTYQTAANAWASGDYWATSNQVNNLDNTANNFKIDLVQLEAGSTATPFETRSVQQELALCQRYYQLIGYGHDYYASIASQIDRVAYTLFVPMRSTPTVGTLTNTNSSNAASISVTGISSYSYQLAVQGSGIGNVGGTGSTNASSEL